MDNKAKALSAAIQRIERGESMVVTVKMQGFTPEPPDGLRRELEAELGRPVQIAWQQITKRDIPRTNNGVITDGKSAEQRYYEEAARRGARTGD